MLQKLLLLALESECSFPTPVHLKRQQEFRPQLGLMGCVTELRRENVSGVFLPCVI